MSLLVSHFWQFLDGLHREAFELLLVASREIGSGRKAGAGVAEWGLGYLRQGQ